MMLLAHSLLTESLAGAVAGMALCRLAPMHLLTHADPDTGRPVRYRATWVAVYLSMFLGAVCALLDIWSGAPSWSATALLASLVIFLWQSRVTWRTGPPPFMRVDPCERLPEPFNLAAGQQQHPNAWPWPRDKGD